MLIIGYADVSSLNISNFNYEDFCKQRIEYLSTITDPKRKKQSFFVWRLLLNVIGEFGLDPSKLIFNKTSSGKWVCDRGLFFCLSHSDDIVAVSVSDDLLNSIDVQVCKPSIIATVKKINKNNAINSKFMSDIIDATKHWTLFELKTKGLFECVDSFVIKDLNGLDYVLSYTFKNDGNNKPIIKKYQF